MSKKRRNGLPTLAPLEAARIVREGGSVLLEVRELFEWVGPRLLTALQKGELVAYCHSSEPDKPRVKSDELLEWMKEYDIQPIKPVN